jgi:DNA-directed RNA polymerase
MKKVKLFLHDRATHVEKRMQITVRERSKTKIKKRKSKSSISPNVIHSMDSSHLMKTVLLLKEQGVVDFFLIHDSFAATPAETDLVYGAVRLAFIEMYDGFCMYQKFLDEANQQLSTAGRDSLNVTIPKKGNLDLWKILESEYCFA